MAKNQITAGSIQKQRWLAVVQGVCGISAILGGIALILLKPEPTGDYFYGVKSTTHIFANAGFGIWGGLIIVATAVTGCTYGTKKSMTSVHTVFQMSSTVVAVVLLSVSFFGISDFVALKRYSCYYHIDYRSAHETDERPSECCFQICPNATGNDMARNDTATHRMTADPLKDYESKGCQEKRDEYVKSIHNRTLACRKKVKVVSAAHLGVFGVLCAVSTIEFIVSIFAVVLVFVDLCRGCCQNSELRVLYVAVPPNTDPKDLPMVLVPGKAPGSTSANTAGNAPAVLENIASGQIYSYPVPVTSGTSDSAPQEATGDASGDIPGEDDPQPPQHAMFGEANEALVET